MATPPVTRSIIQSEIVDPNLDIRGSDVSIEVVDPSAEGVDGSYDVQYKPQTDYPNITLYQGEISLNNILVATITCRYLVHRGLTEEQCFAYDRKHQVHERTQLKDVWYFLKGDDGRSTWKAGKGGVVDKAQVFLAIDRIHIKPDFRWNDLSLIAIELLVKELACDPTVVILNVVGPDLATDEEPTFNQDSDRIPDEHDAFKPSWRHCAPYMHPQVLSHDLNDQFTRSYHYKRFGFKSWKEGHKALDWLCLSLTEFNGEWPAITDMPARMHREWETDDGSTTETDTK